MILWLLKSKSCLCLTPGLIIDAFGELRDQQEQVKEDMEVSVRSCRAHFPDHVSERPERGGSGKDAGMASSVPVPAEHVRSGARGWTRGAWARAGGRSSVHCREAAGAVGPGPCGALTGCPGSCGLGVGPDFLLGGQGGSWQQGPQAEARRLQKLGLEKEQVDQAACPVPRAPFMLESVNVATWGQACQDPGRESAGLPSEAPVVRDEASCPSGAAGSPKCI